MAPGSRGAGAAFSRFFDEDSSQMGEATGEPRVAYRSWSCHLSNTPRLADQLIVSWKDFACEGDCSGEKRVRSSARFSLFFVCVRAHI